MCACWITQQHFLYVAFIYELKFGNRTHFTGLMGMPPLPQVHMCTQSVGETSKIYVRLRGKLSSSLSLYIQFAPYAQDII